MALVLIDTNVLVYAYDRGEHVKQEQAIRVLEYLHEKQIGRVSVQSLSEFFSATTKGKTPILTREQAAQQVEDFVKIWRVLDLTPQVVIEALRGVREHQFAYWDAQIWAVARLNQVPTIFSEDFNVGAELEGVCFVNPFADDFVLSEWK
ncbi:MAG: PIN domain-containing protein [Chloroflexi bacterium]|nr:PIN domain-containing protein [Chloroflexota bacterium]